MHTPVLAPRSIGGGGGGKWQLIGTFGLRFYILINSYGHVEADSSPTHTFFLGKLD